MKTVLQAAVLCIIAAILTGDNAHAETPAAPTPPALDRKDVAVAPAATNDAPANPGLRLKPRAGWQLLGHGLALPLYFLWMSTAHEGSHAISAAAFGAEITAFRPYPHMEYFGGKRYFVWSSMAARTPGAWTPQAEKWMLVAPTITDLTLFTATDLTLTYGVNPDSPIAPLLLIGGMACPLVDFLVNVNGWSDTNDTMRLGKLTGVPKWSIMLVGDALAAVAVWRVLHQGKRIFLTSNQPRRAAPAVSTAFIPTFGPNQAGLAVVGRF